MNKSGGKKIWNNTKKIWESKSKHHKASVIESQALNTLALGPEDVKNKTLARKSFYYLPETIKKSVLQDFTNAITIRNKEDEKLQDPGHIFYTSNLKKFKKYLEETQYTPNKKKISSSPPKLLNVFTKKRNISKKNKVNKKLFYAEGKKQKKKYNTRKKLK
tara:strand:- start:144 stop:626 length:483 start_codon:yes stop_codon:yes gene_type:complete